MFKIRWMTDDRIVLTPAGRFRRIDGALDRARRRLPEMATGFGVTRAEVVDHNDVGVAHVWTDRGTAVAERQPKVVSRTSSSASTRGAPAEPI